MVEIIQSEDQGEILYVTSDRELIRRLKEKGAINVMKSGQYFKMLKKILTDEIYE